MRDIYLTKKVAELIAVVNALATNVSLVKASIPGGSATLVRFDTLAAFRAANSATLSADATVLLLADANGIVGLFTYQGSVETDDGVLYVKDSSNRVWTRSASNV